MSPLVIQSILWAAAAVVALPVLVLFIEVLAATGKGAAPALSPRKGRLAVLIPAHDEEQGIARTIGALLPQLIPGDRLVVVADNCSDATAAKAAAAGATVLERKEPERRGKGFALRFGLEKLAADPPDVMVFVDADTDADPGTLDALNRWATALGKPVQAVNLLQAPPDAGMKSHVSALAFGVKNLVRPRGLRRLGLPCPLLGTGMAIPWALLDPARLSGGNIVEDLQLGIDLAIAGHPAVLCEDARVSGFLPSGDSAAAVQRRRWEHGHLRTLLTQAPRLAAASLTKLKPGLLAMALDLAVPPLSFLCLLWALVFAGTAFAARRGYDVRPLLASSGTGLLLAISVLLAWACHLRRQIPFRALMFVPFYVAWKVPLYLGFLLFRRQKSWVRTPREVG